MIWVMRPKLGRKKQEQMALHPVNQGSRESGGAGPVDPVGTGVPLALITQST